MSLPRPFARTALSQPSKKKRRILPLPRPRLVCVLALLDKYERMGKDERKRELPRFDGRLRDAVTDDMAAYVGEVMSSVAFRGARKGVHGVRTVQELSSFGWTEVRHPYRRGTNDRPDFRRAFGIERKTTPCASETVSRLAVQLGSFKEARDTLDHLDKRRGNMRYGWLRRNGYCISSSHVEAAARILVARRCKQAGMHWRHHNAACVCAIIARLRSVA